jgi:hypothetical protein
MRTTRIWSGALLVLGLVVLQACDETGTTPGDGETHTLTVTLEGLGIGTVTNDETGIACDTTGATCSADIPEGTSVTLTATPAAGSEFVGWGSEGTANPLTVTMDADRSVSATFDNPDLVVESVGTGGGTVTSRDSAITLVFPAGALTGDEDITIERLDPSELGPEWSTTLDSGTIAWAYDFGPDGLQFAVPVELRASAQSYDAGTGDTLAVTVPDVATTQSDTVASVDSIGMNVDIVAGESDLAARIHHFSPYAWIEDFGTVRAEVRVDRSPLIDDIGVGEAMNLDLAIFGSAAIPTLEAVALDIDGPAAAEDTGSLDHVRIRCTGSGTATVRLIATIDEAGRKRTIGFLLAIDCVGNDLTVSTSGQGSGTVTGPDAFGDPGGINCGSGGSVCTGEYGPGNEVTLTGTPDDGSFLDGWRVNGQFVANDGSDQLTITMDGNTTVDAVFEPVPDDELSLLLSGADGTVTSEPAGIDCTKEGETVTGTCSASFEAGTTVELTATTPDGSIATDWSGAGTTTALGTRIVEMVSALSVEMTFPGVPDVATVLDLAGTSIWYMEAMTFAAVLFPFLQASADQGELLASTTGEACPTIIVAADAAVGAVNSCDGSVVQEYFSTTVFYNAFALPRPEGETGDHAIFATGHDYQFFWVNDNGEVTSQVRQTNWGNVPDATAIGGDPANGLAVVRNDGNGTTIEFVRFDPSKGYHDLLTDFVGVTHTPPGLQTVYANGVPTDPAALPEEMLAIGNDGTSGVLYHIETVSGPDPVHTEIGTLAGDNPRRLRCDLGSGICAVSDFANSLVNVILWSGTGTPTIGGSTTAGQIASGPVGLDVYGNYIVTAGYNDDSYSILEVDGSGNVVNATTTALPAGCSSPGHAVFLRDAANTVLVSCNASQAIVRIPNAF